MSRASSGNSGIASPEEPGGRPGYCPPAGSPNRPARSKTTCCWSGPKTTAYASMKHGCDGAGRGARECSVWARNCSWSAASESTPPAKRRNWRRSTAVRVRSRRRRWPPLARPATGAGQSRRLTDLGLIHVNEGNYAQAVTTLEEAHQLVVSLDDPAAQADVRSSLGFALVMAGQPGRALPLLEQAPRPRPARRTTATEKRRLSNAWGLPTPVFANAPERSTSFEQALALAGALGHRKLEADLLWQIVRPARGTGPALPGDRQRPGDRGPPAPGRQSRGRLVRRAPAKLPRQTLAALPDSAAPAAAAAAVAVTVSVVEATALQPAAVGVGLAGQVAVGVVGTGSMQGSQRAHNPPRPAVKPGSKARVLDQAEPALQAAAARVYLHRAGRDCTPRPLTILWPPAPGFTTGCRPAACEKGTNDGPSSLSQHVAQGDRDSR